MNIIISSTNRPNSNSLKVAQYYQKQLKQKGEEWSLLSLEDIPHDILFSDLYGKRSEAFSSIQERISAAEKFIFIIPEYNGSYPGVLKSFIDACAYPISYYNKKAILVGVSTGKYGNIRGVDHFTGVCNYMRMHVLPLKIHIPNIHYELSEESDFTEPITLKFIEEQINEITKF